MVPSKSGSTLGSVLFLALLAVEVSSYPSRFSSRASTVKTRLGNFVPRNVPRNRFSESVGCSRNQLACNAMKIFNKEISDDKLRSFSRTGLVALPLAWLLYGTPAAGVIFTMSIFSELQVTSPYEVEPPLPPLKVSARKNKCPIPAPKPPKEEPMTKAASVKTVEPVEEVKPLTEVKPVEDVKPAEEIKPVEEVKASSEEKMVEGENEFVVPLETLEEAPAEEKVARSLPSVPSVFQLSKPQDKEAEPKDGGSKFESAASSANDIVYKTFDPLSGLRNIEAPSGKSGLRDIEAPSGKSGLRDIEAPSGGSFLQPLLEEKEKEPEKPPSNDLLEVSNILRKFDPLRDMVPDERRDSNINDKKIYGKIFDTVKRFVGKPVPEKENA